MPASYLDAVKAKLEQLKNNGKTPKKDSKEAEKSKLKWFKPEIAEYEIRFLQYFDINNQPFEEVLYYNNISERRVLAPYQYELEDPIKTFLDELEKGRKDKEVWKEWNSQRAKPRFYGIVLVRGQESEGPMVWEFSSEVCTDIYTTLSHKNYAEKNMFDAEKGYDFTLQVTAVPGKMFKGYPVKQYKLIANIEPSALGTKKQIAEWTKAIPNLREYFKGMISSPEKLQMMVENYVNKGDSEEESTGETARGSDTSNEEEVLKDAFKNL